MFFRILTIFALIISLFIFANAQNKSVKLAIINGLSIELVKPEYPKIAVDLCAAGKVEVETLINKKEKWLKPKQFWEINFFIELLFKLLKNRNSVWGILEVRQKELSFTTLIAM